MNPINKISGNLCSVCRTIISSEPGNNLMCPKCQEKSIGLLKELIRTNDDILKISDVIVKSSRFLKELIYD
jgi:predicted RNA-binding Zn-ribbon protein involved in translation (DUF1610 family)